ncbi:ParB/RepB/Spo0J family partition protein [Deferribacter autotrophicus]|uniref:ParB/RepB/Spo0J family partition protein n=1 Tax=Deferribacter autotrophicus TaxID=500465 RepID=A0A5A8F0H7_9BACT|nr:ParB/RepB/Spo0J family partition protein [Deferribacter autotrophicus]KAA0257519.1 ParB/RepB/Spo0J family partition protein [Deferribacter autotrophicus]
MNVKMIEINKLKQHTKNKDFFEDMVGYDFEELKRSIVENGLIEPLIVTPDKNGYYKIICGNQRYKACKELNIEEIPCIIKEFKNEDEELKTLIEDNLVRRHLTPYQRAKLMNELFKLSNKKTKTERIKELSQKTEYKERQISKYLKIAENLIREFAAMLDKGEININTANELATHSKEVQYEIYNIIKEKAVDDVKNTITEQLQRIKQLLNENKKKDEKIKQIEKEYSEFKNLLKIKSLDPETKKHDAEIVRDIITINVQILNLIKKCLKYSVDMKKMGFADENIKMDVTLFSEIKPPVFPIFKVDLKDIADYIELSKDVRKYEEVIEEHVLKYLE